MDAMRRSTAFIVAVLLLSGVCVAAAQRNNSPQPPETAEHEGGVVRGKVSDAYTEQPVVGATVVVAPTFIGGIVKLKLTAVLDAQHGGFTTGWSPVSWGSIDELFVNLTVSIIPLPAEVAR